MNLSSEASWMTRATSVAQSLVLFVGMGPRPGSELAEGLARSGVRGLWLDRADQALAAAEHARFDAAVVRLDESIGTAARQFDGWRRGLGCPLLILAEMEDEVDEIMALELGADGVLAQPVSQRRLRAHLVMLLRRAWPIESATTRAVAAPAPEPARAAGWTLDRGHNVLSRGTRRVALTEMQASMMQLLMDEQGRVVPRSRLLAAASRRRPLQARSIDVYIARLRQRLLDERVDELQIEGVRGRGYVLMGLAPSTVGWLGPAAAATPLGDPATVRAAAWSVRAGPTAPWPLLDRDPLPVGG
jgi:DNA-binding response OmpR family regulator